MSNRLLNIALCWMLLCFTAMTVSLILKDHKPSPQGICPKAIGIQDVLYCDDQQCPLCQHTRP